MFNLKATLRAPRLDLAGYRRALADRAKETITDSAFAWVETAISIIPVWSGASVTTFIELAQDINFQLNVQPVSGAPDRTSEGLAASVSGVLFDEARGIFSFGYATNLPWLVFNEQFNADVKKDPNVFSRLIQPGPYNFQEQANTAAKGIFDAFTPPDLRPFISTTIVT